MALTFESAKTWVNENPVKAAGIGAGAVIGIALLVSEKARKMVGLAGVPESTRQLKPHRRRKRSKKQAKAKSLVLN